jgi:hypothetical protein
MVCEGVNSELDLFKGPTYQSSVLDGRWLYVKPHQSIQDNNPIEFNVSGSGDEYLDLAHSYICLEVEIVKTNGHKVVDDAVVGPVNSYGNSLFPQIITYLNQKQVSSSSQLYPYRAMFETLLNYGPAAKESHLTSDLYYKDSPGHMDSLTLNTGFLKRASLTHKSKKTSLIFYPHCDLFNMDRFLPNGVELRLKLIRNKPEFYLMSVNGGFKTKILDATLVVRKVRISSSVMLAHNQVLEKANFKLPFSRNDTRHYSVPAGLLSKSLSLHNGVLPKVVGIAMVKNQSLNGESSLNPYNFESFDHSFQCIYVDGQQVPSKPLQPNFENGDFIHNYNTLYTGTGIHYHDRGNNISREDYGGGYALTMYDITPNLNAGSCCWSLPREGELRFEIHFKKALVDPIDIIVYMDFDSMIEITKFRDIILDYTG